jgi:hypothetical protein
MTTKNWSFGLATKVKDTKAGTEADAKSKEEEYKRTVDSRFKAEAELVELRQKSEQEPPSPVIAQEGEVL